MKEVELIIFDMDGLMFDTERIAFTAWKRAASVYGYEIDEHLLKKTIGVNLEGTEEILIKHFGLDFPIDNIEDERFRITQEILNQNGVPVKSGLYKLLEYLGKVNIRKAVATSTSRQRAETLLKMANIEDCFDYVICGDEINNSKPHPEIFLKVAEKFCCSPENCIVLEDSDVGVLAAHRANMLPIMIPDIKEPDIDVKKIIYKQFTSLLEVKMFFENNDQIKLK